MPGVGTLINIAAIVAGGLIGLLCGKVMTARYQETLMSATGVCVLFVGIGGAVEEMMTVPGRNAGIPLWKFSRKCAIY